ncbi:phosphotransferase enzyme family protein [Roseovarius dicentrarchi]|uniref:phosphotransferase enzyme family protein n=1 Tax=Roseovarius dicentrarchi TaxID=2250573 RepID=UPI001939E2D9|nr:phosphotransferase [Roseovarius dicentrarchi]
MAQPDMPLAELLTHLDRLAQHSLRLWDIPPGARAHLINVAENATYLVEDGSGYRAILRIHREQYHTRRAIECELAWIAALKQARAVVTPDSYVGKNGQVIQEGRIDGLDAPRFMVLFQYIEGTHPDEAGDLERPFEELGEIAALTHEHSKSWQRPADFQRLVWNTDTVFGPAPTWGNWRDAPNVTQDIAAVLDAVEARVCARLKAFGNVPDRYGLIHADMRLANLLTGPQGTRLIDFDDCGFGWFLYDFAAGISFMEDDPRVPALKAAWVRGYNKVRALSGDELAEMDTFILLRRMALLAWIGSHIEAPEPQAMAPDFARVTARLGAEWLAQTANRG